MFSAEHVLDSPGNMIGGKRVLVQQIQIGAGFGKGIPHPDAFHGDGMIFHQHLGNRTAKTAKEYIVFSRNDGAGLRGGRRAAARRCRSHAQQPVSLRRDEGIVPVTAARSRSTRVTP